MYDADQLIDINIHWARRWEKNESENKKEKKEEQEGGVKVIVNTIFVCSMYLGVNE